MNTRARNRIGGERAQQAAVPAAPPRLLFVGDCQTLASLGATPLQDDSAVFRSHSNPEAVCLLAASSVRLKCALSLHAGLYAKSGCRWNWRNFNTSRRSSGLSKDSQSRVNSVLQSRVHPVRGMAKAVRFLPQEFHNCGKHCGKHRPLPELQKIVRFFGHFHRPEPWNRRVSCPSRGSIRQKSLLALDILTGESLFGVSVSS